VLRFDLNRFMNMVLDYPEAFGLTNTERYVMKFGNETEDYAKMGFA